MSDEKKKLKVLRGILRVITTVLTPNRYSILQLAKRDEKDNEFTGLLSRNLDKYRIAKENNKEDGKSNSLKKSLDKIK